MRFSPIQVTYETNVTKELWRAKQWERESESGLSVNEGKKIQLNYMRNEKENAQHTKKLK